MTDTDVMRALALPQRWHTGTGWSRLARGRVWAVLLAAAIALASFMHVAHTHEADVPASFKFCSFCVTFERGGAPPPAVMTAVIPAAPVATAIVVEDTLPQGRVARRPCHARAPPALQA